MNIITYDEIVQFANTHYTQPTLKTWEADEWLKNYRYKDLETNKRTQKRYQKEKEKRDAEYLKEFNNIKAKRDSVFDTLRKISTYPAEISTLFYQTLILMVNDGINARENFQIIKNEFNSKYDFKTTNSMHYSPANFSYYLLQYYKNVYDENAKKYVWKCDNKDNLNYIKTVCPKFEEIQDKDQFFEDTLEYKKFKNISDDSLYPSDALDIGCSKLNDICYTINQIFQGIPEECITDANWGIGSYFNGILKRGDIKASFKSFLAGGWNIQRRHIRFRITKLKG